MVLLLPFVKKKEVLYLSKVYCVGIGPGSYESMTIEAINALEKSDSICVHLMESLQRLIFTNGGSRLLTLVQVGD